MRYTKEKLHPYMVTNISHLSRVAELYVLNTLSKPPRIDGLQSADEMLGFFFGGSLDKQNLLEVLGHLKTGQTYELMCHPGKSDSNSMYSHWNYNWQSELNALKDAEVKNYLINKNIDLINYKYLKGQD